MKLLKAIKLQRRLRIRQEYLCFKVCQHSRNLPRDVSPFFNEFCSVNKAVENVNNKLPGMYFILSDLFGGAYTLKKQSEKYINEKENRWRKNIKPFVFDLIPDPGFTSEDKNKTI